MLRYDLLIAFLKTMRFTLAAPWLMIVLISTSKSAIAQVNPHHGIPDTILLSAKRCVTYADEILEGKRPLEKGASRSAVYIAKVASIASMGRYNEADSLFQKLIKDSAEVLGQRDFLSVHQARSGYLTSVGRLSDAETEGMICVASAEELNDSSTLAMCLINLGNAVLWQGRDDDALENYIRALKIISERSHATSRKTLYENIAIVYSRRDSMQLAMKYCQMAIGEGKRLMLKDDFGLSYGNLAYYRMASGLFDDSTQALLQEAERLFKVDEQPQYLPWIYNLNGYYFGEKGDVRSAKDYMLKGLFLLNTDENPYEAVRIYCGLAANYGRLGMRDSSLHYLGKAAKDVDRCRDLDLHIRYLKIRVELENEFGLLSDAVNTYDKLLLLKDSLALTEQRGRIDEILEKYNTEQLRRESLEKDVRLLEVSTSKQRLIILIAALLLAGALVFLTLYYRSNQSLKRANALLLALNQKEQRIEELERMEGITLERLNKMLPAHVAPISIAEFEVIQVIVEQGVKIKMADLAEGLNISYDTLKSRKRAIARKLGCVSSTNEAIFQKVSEACSDV